MTEYIKLWSTMVATVDIRWCTKPKWELFKFNYKKNVKGATHNRLLYYSCYSSYFGLSHQGSPQPIFHIQLFLSSVSSSVTSTSATSPFITSINLLFGLPRFLFPGSSIISILLPIYPSSFLRTCP